MVGETQFLPRQDSEGRDDPNSVLVTIPAGREPETRGP